MTAHHPTHLLYALASLEQLPIRDQASAPDTCLRVHFRRGDAACGVYRAKRRTDRAAICNQGRHESHTRRRDGA
jgi:ATP-dependent Clp protease adapter protein ClpS